MVTALLIAPEQQAALRDKAEVVGELVATPCPPREQTPSSIDEERDAAVAKERYDWYGEVKQGVIGISEALPEGAEDYDVRKLLEFLLELRDAIDNDPTGEDAAGKVELAKMQMSDVAHRIGRRLLHGQLDDPRTAIDYIFRTLQGVGVGEIASLLGVSSKTVNAWRAGGSAARNTNTRRVVTVAQLLSYLRASMTPRGLAMWFDAPREQLGGRTPLQTLDEDEEGARETLVELARGARGQLAD